MKTEDKIRMQYAGAVNLLANLCVEVGDEEDRSCIEMAVADWCSITGWSYKRILNRVELLPPGV